MYTEVSRSKFNAISGDTKLTCECASGRLSVKLVRLSDYAVWKYTGDSWITSTDSHARLIIRYSPIHLFDILREFARGLQQPIHCVILPTSPGASANIVIRTTIMDSVADTTIALAKMQIDENVRIKKVMMRAKSVLELRMADISRELTLVNSHLSNLP